MKSNKSILASAKHNDSAPYCKSLTSANASFTKDNSNAVNSCMKTLEDTLPPLMRAKTKAKTRIKFSIPQPSTPKEKKEKQSFTSYSLLKTDSNSTSNIRPRNSRQYLTVSSALLTQDTLSSQVKTLINQAAHHHHSFTFESNDKEASKPFKKAESSKLFLNKTNDLIRLKYTSKIKAEQIERMRETYDNSVQTVNDRKKAIQNANDLFSVTFCNKFNLYIKHLIQQKNAEKVELKRIRSEKDQAENDYMSIQYKIRLKERELVKKKKWHQLQKLFKDNQVSQDKAATPSHSKLNEIELYFHTPEEFISELKKYEMFNLLLLNNFNDINVEIRELEIQQDILLLKTNNQVIQLISQCDQKAIELDQLKAKHIELQRDKISMLSMKSESLDSKSFPRLYSNILSLYNAICSSASMYLHHLRLRSPVDTVSMLSLLTFIEKTADFFIDKNSKYFLNTTLHNEKIYQIARKKALKERQAVLQMKIKADNINKTSQLANKVNKKINAVYFIPFRKVDKYYYKNAHKEIKKKKPSVNKTDDIVDINDLLHDIIE